MFYRPTPSEFGQLDNSVQRHVLGGGLLLAELGASPVDSDPVEHDWTYKRFRQWAMDYYRLTPEAWEVLS